jgi:enoyl-CoA hydratase/carnithine racemase
MNGPGASPLRIDRVPLEDQPGVLVVLTLDRPAVMNAIDDAMLAALHAALDEVETDAGVRGVVVAGAGERAFCAGMDLKERAGFSDDDLRAQRALIVGMIRRLHELPVPTIAAVDGVALGGGFELALACDLIVAGAGATFGLPEVKVGIFPGGGSTQTLTWLVGPARARDVILTGRRLSPAEAEAWGVVARVVPAGGALAAAIALARSVAEGAPLGIRQAKAAIRGAHGALADGLDAENALYETVLVSDDRREGFTAFAEKRKPRFTGR